MSRLRAWGGKETRAKVSERVYERERQLDNVGGVILACCNAPGVSVERAENVEGNDATYVMDEAGIRREGFARRPQELEGRAAFVL